MPLNILVVTRWYPSHDAPGRGIFVADQVAALAAAGVRIRVVAPEPVIGGSGHRPSPGETGTVAHWVAAIAADQPYARPRNWGASGIPLVRFPALLPTGDGAERDPVEVTELQARALVPFGLELARTWPIDLIHAHTGLPDGVSAARLADRLGVPLVVTEHESVLARRLASDGARTLYRTLFAPGRRVVAVSWMLADQLTGLLGIAPGEITVVPNSVDVASFHAVGPEGRDPNELLWVGARRLSKGIDRLLEAFALVRQDRPALRLRLIGRSSADATDDRLLDLARDLGIETAISLEPAADRAAVAAAMERAGLFVHPSPRETFGVVAVEALASGLPVAATPSGGVEEILGDDGACGEIADTATGPALAAAIGRALDRRAEFDPLRLRARAVERYAAPAVAARIVDLYGTLVDPAVVAARDGGATDEPSVAIPFRMPSILVGLRRRAIADHLANLPAGLGARLAVVTSVGSSPAESSAFPATASLREVDADAAFRAERQRAGGPLPPASGTVRALRAIRHPMRARRLRALARARTGMAGSARLAVIRAAIEELPPSDRVEILPIDADDVAAIAPLLGERIHLYPGTLRGFVDGWDGAGRPAAGGPPTTGSVAGVEVVAGVDPAAGDRAVPR